jgi:transposase InsO family protein
MFTRIGLHEVLLSDNGAQFTGFLMKEVLQILNTKHLRTSPYYPQVNVLLKRFDQKVESMLTKVACSNTDEWDTYLLAALCAYHTSLVLV